MNIVIDNNRLIAALIKDSTTRELILNDIYTFYAPEFISIELKKYQKEIAKKANLNIDLIKY